MTEFASVEQILEIRDLIAKRDWNSEKAASEWPKYVSRIAVVNLVVGWATDMVGDFSARNSIPVEVSAVATASTAGVRVNQIFARLRKNARPGQEYCYADLNSVGAVNLISWLRRQPVKSEEPVQGELDLGVTRKDQELAAEPLSKELEDGMYRTADGTIFKVYKTQRGFQVAKRLMVDENPDGTTSIETGEQQYVKTWFEYEGKRPLARLNASMRMSYDEMKKFGAIYGSCCCCGRTLTDELSVALGIGPICGNREFGEEFKQTVKLTRAELKAAKKAGE